MLTYDAKELDGEIKRNMSCHDILDLVLLMSRKPDVDNDLRGFQYLGFDTMQEYIRDFKDGLAMQPKSFVSIVLAFQHSPDKPVELFNYLIHEEGWHELEQHLPPELVARLGIKGAKHGGKRGQADNISLKHGTAASYVTKRLARDADDSPAIAEIYEKLKAGLISANKAAIEAGYRKRQVQIPAEPDAMAERLKQLLTSEQRRILAALLLDE